MNRRAMVPLLGGAVALLGLTVRTIEAQHRSPLTIDQLIDIKHPSNPVWSRDGRRIAFLWERAGVANLYVVPADGSAKPVALTTDGEPVLGLFWSADNETIEATLHLLDRRGIDTKEGLEERARNRGAEPLIAEA